MKKIIVIFMLIALTTSVQATISAGYGWEDGVGTVLGTYGNVGSAENSLDQAHTGTHSLKVFEDPLGSTPQVFLWWVTGLEDGDTITSILYCYDTTPAAENPKGRIWGSYTSDINDIDSYSGSAGGPTDYSNGPGWSALTGNWTFVANGGTNTGLIVQGRIYSDETNRQIYFDDVFISVSNDDAIIHRADGAILPEPAIFGLLPLLLLFLRRK